MECILEILASLLRYVQGAVASLSSEDFVPTTKPVQLNDYVHVIHDPPPDRRPSVEIVFFHGFQFETTQGPYLKTWLSRDGTQLWLNWILNEFPDARILVISYDASFRRTNADGIAEMFITGENLVISLVDAKIGQGPCPVLLVGHCVGGLVMKEICIQARSFLPLHSYYRPVQNFLNSIKGLVYYATPNLGSEVAEISTHFAKGPLVEGLSILNKEAARRNHNFSLLRKEYGWKALGVAEGLEVTLGAFKGYFVAEASARSDIDTFYTVAANHFDVCRPESPNSSSFRLFVDFVGRMVKEDEVRHKPQVVISEEVIGLRSQTNVVKRILAREQRVGIIGVGGIGKTTLAKVLFTAISGNFEYACFLEYETQDQAKDEKPEQLRMKIIKSLHWKGQKVDNNFQWSFLKGKKVLVVLDGANSASQVQVMTKSDEFSQDSRLVVTSRERGFLRPEKFAFHDAQTLDIKDSQTLFCLHAYKTGDVPSEYEENVVRITKKCGGLPLALKVAGSYLCEREYLWDDVLVKLDQAQPLDGNAQDALWSILNMSYDSLAKAEKEIFLDVATVLHGKRLHEVKQMWKACDWRAESGWVNLLDKGLVTQVPTGFNNEWEEDRNYTIQMHDMLRDLGRSKACPGLPNFSDHSRIICKADDLADWSFNQGVGEEKSKVEVLQVYGSLSSSINIDGLHRMDKLRILLLEGGYADRSTTLTARLSGARYLLPSSLVYLSIKDTGDEISCIEFGSQQASSRNRQQRQGLRCLEFVTCPQLQSLPTFVGQLHCLQHLTIEECSRLETLPVSLGNLPALQELRIDGCQSLKAIPDSLGDLRSLQDLTLLNCQSLDYLPVSLGRLLSLRYLKIKYCQELKRLPNSLWQLKALKRLDLQYPRYMDYLELDDSVPSPDLKSQALSATLGKLQALQHLHLLGVNSSTLPEAIGQLRGLVSLSVDRCETLTSLPDTLGDLKGLKLLKIFSCNKLESLPSSVGELKALTHLHLVGCDALKSLPTTLGELLALESLHIYSGVDGGVDRLPDIFKHLQALKYLNLSNFKYVPDSIGELGALQQLSLNMHPHGAEPVPDSLGRLQALTHLHLGTRSEGTPHYLGELRNLEELSIFAGYLEALPDSLGELQSLRRLVIHCDRLMALPETLGQLRELEELSLIYCLSLCALPDTLGKLESLRKLSIMSCHKLEEVPASLAQCEFLALLDITKSQKLLSGIPDSLLPVLSSDRARYGL